jgi:hypothetical protein
VAWCHDVLIDRKVIHVARKKTGAFLEAPDRQIAFRAPDVVHGGLKEIIGRLERNSFRIGQKPPSGQDLLNWIIADLYMQGPENWAKRVESAHAQFVKFCDQN